MMESTRPPKHSPPPAGARAATPARRLPRPRAPAATTRHSTPRPSATSIPMHPPPVTRPQALSCAPHAGAQPPPPTLQARRAAHEWPQGAAAQLWRLRAPSILIHVLFLMKCINRLASQPAKRTSERSVRCSGPPPCFETIPQLFCGLPPPCTIRLLPPRPWLCTKPRLQPLFASRLSSGGGGGGGGTLPRAAATSPAARPALLA